MRNYCYNTSTTVTLLFNNCSPIIKPSRGFLCVLRDFFVLFVVYSFKILRLRSEWRERKHFSHEALEVYTKITKGLCGLSDLLPSRGYKFSTLCALRFILLKFFDFTLNETVPTILQHYTCSPIIKPSRGFLCVLSDFFVLFVVIL